MSKFLLTTAIAFVSINLFGQVGIGTEDPKATLDIRATDNATVDGILIPRISRAKAFAMQNVEESTLIYINDVSDGSQTGSVEYVDSPGYYYFQNNRWFNLPNKNEVIKLNYWDKQGVGSSSSPRSENRTTDSFTDNVEDNIFQKGKVGIGYSDELEINFEDNPTQKQLEVGGDFRTSYYHSPNSVFYGFETNSTALPAPYATRGNVMYSAKSKSLTDYSNYYKNYDGNIMIQSNDEFLILSRTGKYSDFGGTSFYENQMTSQGNNQFVYNFSQDGLSDFMYTQTFDLLGFRVFDWDDDNNEFGFDFSRKKFYIGNRWSGGSGYYFPNTKGSSGQVLKLNNANDLVWADLPVVPATSSPKFFYMPSLLLPTVPNAEVNVYKIKNPQYPTNSSDEYLDIPSFTYDDTNKVFTVDLYKIFNSQFNFPVASSVTISSSNPNPLEGFVLTAEQYDYFVSYADMDTFNSITLSADGKLSYKVNPEKIIRNGSFMNIVLKVK